MKMLLVGALWAGVVVAESAVNFEWNSNDGAVNRLSDGVTLMDSSFEFVIGNFSAGFDPKTRDWSEWVENFEVLDTAFYLDEFKQFLVVTSIGSNASPYGLTDDVYIWGRNGTESGSEWILVKSDSWSWPNANPIGPPIPKTLRMGTATDSEALVGSVNTGGVHMQTEKVTFEVSYATWAEGEFEPGEESGEDDDPDGDGNDNFFEYAVGSDPKKKDAGLYVSMNADREIRIERPEERQVIWKVEASDDLTNFSEMESGFEIVSEGPEELVIRITEALTTRKFYRAVAVVE